MSERIILQSHNVTLALGECLDPKLTLIACYITTAQGRRQYVDITQSNQGHIAFRISYRAFRKHVKDILCQSAQ